jgi:hypothetical protein
LAHHYNPDQPRIPAHHDGGGRWTAGVPAPLSELDPILNSRGEGGRAGAVQLAFLDSRKPPTRIKLPGGLGILGLAAEIIYSYLSKDNNDKQRTILSFTSHEFHRDGDGSFTFNGVQVLTGEEIKKECGELEKVQKYTDEAFNEVKKYTKQLSPQQFGTAVHKLVENKMKADPELKDVVEVEKSFANDDRPPEDVYYGADGTFRLDVYYKVNDNTICIDDIKTGRKGLSYKRMLELVESATRGNKNIKKVIITQVRPDVPSPPK